MFRGVDLLPASAIAIGVVLAAIPFVFELSLAVLVPLWIVSTLLRSVAPVHQHCHAHYRVFRNRAVDAAYDVVLMLAAGNTTAVWELQHVRGHHQAYLDRTHDPANNDRFGGRFAFTVLGDAMSTIDSWRIARGHVRLRVRLVAQVALQLAVLVAAFVVDPQLALAFVVAPWLLLRWLVFFISYSQHDDVPMTNVYDGSVTHFGAISNRFYLNVGHHTAHHEKPTLHWTLLPARTAQIIERIHPACLR